MGDVGFMAGIYSAVKSLGEMVGSTVAGFSYAIYSKLPFLIAAVAITIALFFSVFYYFTNKNKCKCYQWRVVIFFTSFYLNIKRR